MVKGSGQHLSKSGSGGVDVPVQLEKEGTVGGERGVEFVYSMLFL